jgi:hypothetical protein
MFLQQSFEIRDTQEMTCSYCGVSPIKCRQGQNEQTNCRFWKKLTFDWLVDNPTKDLFGQRSIIDVQPPFSAQCMEKVNWSSFRGIIGGLTSYRLIPNIHIGTDVGPGVVT